MGKKWTGYWSCSLPSSKPEAVPPSLPCPHAGIGNLSWTAGLHQVEGKAWIHAGLGVVPGEGIHGVCVGKLKQAASVTLLLPSLPSLPSAVAEWLPPTAWGAIGVFLAVNWMETKASESRLNQRIDEVKEEFQASEARLNQRIDEVKEEFQAGEARVNQHIDEVKEEFQAGEARVRNELKASEARVRDELKASEARQAQRTDELRADMNRQMADLRADNRVLGEKMDRLLELLATVKQT